MAETVLSAVKAITEPAIHAVSSGVPDASDASNGNYFANTGVEALVVDNTGASSRTIQFRDSDAVAIGDAVTVAANAMAVFGPFDPRVYGDNVLWLASSTDLHVRAFDISRVKNLISRKRHI